MCKIYIFSHSRRQIRAKARKNNAQRKVPHLAFPLYLNAENKKYTCPTPALKISLHMLYQNLLMASQIELLLEQIKGDGNEK
jgi:hypothetical protein